MNNDFESGVNKSYVNKWDDQPVLPSSGRLLQAWLESTIFRATRASTFIEVMFRFLFVAALF